MKSISIINAASWLVTLLVPVVLVLSAVRALVTPAFVFIEYNTPGFPTDPYGFTKEDRLLYANIAVDYLLNDEDISFLGDLRFPQGETAPPQTCQSMDDCTRLYNDRELQHMVDVKNVVQGAMRTWVIAFLVVVFLGFLAWRFNWWESYRHALGRGGWLTVIMLAGIILFVLVAFGVLFVAFHEVFFDSGTWTFLYSDTLIRLFPERFWRDTFIAVGILAGLAGVLFGYLFRQSVGKKE
ncbi:MAG TPA: TIGR01906 family membrane protein [Anaerolineales bacterium]|nr:TIGR01906 family membrane protein [Anaerolineales bacterium]